MLLFESLIGFIVYALFILIHEIPFFGLKADFEVQQM